ncbi:MAG: fused MFS/spermidine synthase [Acidobacteriota bacterium]|nr:fused MFS/spermidine synthase [Acidobacteriota bacterium]
MPSASIATILVDAVATACARLRGLTYLGRTMAGWTTVHDAHMGGERIRVLDVAGTYQSATYLDSRWCDPVFPYHRLFDHLFEAWPDGGGPTSVAVLGGGGYAIPRHLVAHHPEVRRVDVVELDPAIERIARRHFFLDRLERTYGAEEAGRLRLHTCDAHAWLLESEDTFDAIINDCFFGRVPERSLMSAEAAACAQAHLGAGGVYLTNVVAALSGPESHALRLQMAALATCFSHLWIYPCGTDDPQVPDNNVVIATDCPHVFEGAWEWDAGKGELA